MFLWFFCFFFFKQKTAYEMRISDWSSDVCSSDLHKPLIIRGTVRSDTGELLAGAVIDVWHSTPDGLYSGIHDNIPVDYYRGKLVTESQGNYRVRTTMPETYKIPYEGPTGRDRKSVV